MTSEESDALYFLRVGAAHGRRHYQVRATLPGGRIIVTGATHARRDWARQDIARLFGAEEKHFGVTKIRPRAWRLPRVGRKAGR